MRRKDVTTARCWQRRGGWTLVLVLCSLFVVSCTAFAPLTPRSSPTTVTDVAIGQAETPVSPPMSSTITASPLIITVTVWCPPLFAPGETTGASRVLAAQAEEFAAAYPDYRLDWVVKPPNGAGNILEFLRSARDVAPAILPDIVILEDRELEAAARDGLLQPLDSLMSEDLRSDLFNASLEAGYVDHQWYGIQFETDIAHLIYNTTLVDAAPLTWTDVISESIPYAFPAGGDAGQANDVFLIQYLARGGKLTDDAGAPFVDEAFVRDVLSFYARGLAAELFPQAIAEMSTDEEVVSSLTDGEAAICTIHSDFYLGTRDQLRNTGFATIPTWNGTRATVGDGHVLAIVTSEPARQAAAKSAVDWFLEPTRLVAWARAAGHLPTRISAIDLWGANDNYVRWASSELRSAYHVPQGPEYVRAYVSLQEAVQDVVAGTLSPEEAARRAADAINTER
jgi:ABC-type glycerol-3-phosphate transport system substrate-binding protein